MTTAISELKQRYALLEPSPSLQRRTRAMMHAVRKRRGSKRHSLRRAGASVAILCVLLLLLVGGLIGTRSLPADYTMQLRAGGDGGRPGFGALPVGSTLSEPIENTPSEPV
ncbi:MAG: hypothetical protein Q4A66_10975, partial [Eubacteriales bacterium]|nr:hypothetical protein [Eubacteriales bacterium]